MWPRPRAVQMRLPLSLEVQDGGYGQHCDSCRKITATTIIKVMYRGEVFRQSLLCPDCIEQGIEVDLNLEMGADPQKSADSKKRIKQSRKLEKVLADDLGGVPQPGSGGTRLAGFKGDVRKMGQWRVEHKYTDSLKQYIVKLADIAKIIHHALEANENPALIIEFRRVRQALAVIPYTLFLELAGEATDHKGPASRRRRRAKKSSG